LQVFTGLTHCVAGPSGTVSVSYKAQMPYTNAFMQEVYRYRTLAPIGNPHMANVTTKLNEYVIPKGTQVRNC